MKKITTFRENLESLQNRYAQVSAENVALSERLAAQIADKQRILEHFSHYEGTHNCACRFPDDGDDPDGECGYHAALRAQLKATERQRDAAVAVFDMVTRIPTMSSDELAQLIANCRQAIDAALAADSGSACKEVKP